MDKSIKDEWRRNASVFNCEGLSRAEAVKAVFDALYAKASPELPIEEAERLIRENVTTNGDNLNREIVHITKIGGTTVDFHFYDKILDVSRLPLNAYEILLKKLISKSLGAEYV